MPTRRPAYYEEIDERFVKLEERQREFRESMDSVQVNQGEQMSRINQIHILLAGTEYDKNNGGLVGSFNKVKGRVHKNTAWRIKITTAVSAVGVAIGFVLLKFGSIISSLRELIKPN